MTQLQPLIKQLPEPVKVSAGGKGRIHQVDGDNALIEPAIIPVLAGLIALGVGDIANTSVCEPVRSQSRPAAHHRIDIPFELHHDFLADIIGNHPLGGTLGSQFGEIPVGVALVDIILLQHIDELGEGNGHIDTLLIFHAGDTLLEYLLDTHSQVGLELRVITSLVQVHE